jgi:Ca-activated chloride channel family protein
MSFLSPLWALMGLIAIPIILLYVLRQKRPDMPVSSTLLWSKTLADMRASTPFQKLRRNLLLLLQLLILAALVFTLMRPVVQASASRSEAGVIVIDATASMQTRDGSGGTGAGETRLDRAKIEAKALVDQMRPADRYMLIADGGGMKQVRSGFTSSKSELKGLIDSIKASDTSSDLAESLLLAATSLRAIGADSKTGGPRTDGITAGQVYLISDGAGIKMPDALGDKGLPNITHVRIGNSDHNVGITRLSITPVPKQPGTYEVFVGLKNAWSVEKKVGVTLATGTKDNFMPDQAKFVTLPAGGTGGVAFEGVVAPPGKLFARVDETDDDFILDNTAYGIVEPPRKVRVVLVTRGNEFLERLVQTAVNVGTAEGQIVAPDFYNANAPADLFILDGFLPPEDKLPRVDTILVRPSVPASAATAAGQTIDMAGFMVAHEISNPTVLRWKREDPLMQYVELGDLRISKALLMDKDPGAIELVSAPEGPLIAMKDFGAVRRYFVSFSPLVESNWWRLPSLIIFMQNAIEQTRQRHFIGMPEMLPSGNPAKLWGGVGDEPETRVEVTEPNGEVLGVGAKDGVAEFGQTDTLGFYEVKWPAAAGAAEKRSLFAVNLLSDTESNITPQSLQAGPDRQVDETTSVARVNREIWRWLAVAALAILLLEWWAYHRRVA